MQLYTKLDNMAFLFKVSLCTKVANMTFVYKSYLTLYSYIKLAYHICIQKLFVFKAS